MVRKAPGATATGTRNGGNDIPTEQTYVLLWLVSNERPDFFGVPTHGKHTVSKGEDADDDEVRCE